MEPQRPDPACGSNLPLLCSAAWEWSSCPAAAELRPAAEPQAVEAALSQCAAAEPLADGSNSELFCLGRRRKPPARHAPHPRRILC